ncbi:MAG: hypothetical protein KAT68_18230 [Bacteroidales bacterium]|nr:hypothetical protein [Bacteroidales bacterium]
MSVNQINNILIILSKTIIILVIVILFNINSFGQQNNTLYFIHKIPQSGQLNPALYQNCKLQLGGIIMPLTGQILPPIYFNYGNNAFAYKHAIYHGEGTLSDSLITAFNSIADGNKFVDRFRDVNVLSFENNYDIFFAGYTYEKYYFSFTITEKIYARISFPGDIIRFAWELNGKSFLGNDINLSNIGINAAHYREYAFGTARQINEKLNVGVRAKVLFGKSNVWTKKNDLTWHTDEDDFTYTLKSDIEIKASQPAIEVQELYYDTENDSLVITTEELDFDPIDYLLNDKNLGFGIDLGASYLLNNEFSFYASIIDLGYIKWTDNVSDFKENGEFVFQGTDAIKLVDKNDTSDIEETYTDSLLQIFKIQHNSNAYNAFLPAKIYLGATYFIRNEINFGILLRGEIYQRKLHASTTLSVNTNLSRCFSASLSYSIINNSYNNLGLGIVLKGGPFQFYILNDNVLGMVFPQITQNVNFRFGINWRFKCNIENNSLIE